MSLRSAIAPHLRFRNNISLFATGCKMPETAPKPPMPPSGPRWSTSGCCAAARHRAAATDGDGYRSNRCRRGGALDAALPPHAASVDRHDDRIRGVSLNGAEITDTPVSATARPAMKSPAAVCSPRVPHTSTWADRVALRSIAAHDWGAIRYRPDLGR